MINRYQYEMSPFCTKTALLLNVKRVPYEIMEVQVSRSRGVKNYSYTSNRPVIEDDGKFIYDSTDIADYLDEKYPELALFPSDGKVWARCHVSEDWTSESLDFYMMKIRWLQGNRPACGWGNCGG